MEIEFTITFLFSIRSSIGSHWVSLLGFPVVLDWLLAGQFRQGFLLGFLGLTFSVGLYWVFTGFYQVLLGSTKMKWVLIEYYLALTLLYWIVLAWLGLTGFDCFFIRFYWVVLGFTEFHWVSLGCNRFYWVLLGFIGFDTVLLSFTGFYWVSYGFT